MKPSEINITATHNVTGKQYKFTLADISTGGSPDNEYGIFDTVDIETNEYHEIPDWEVDDYDFVIER